MRLGRLVARYQAPDTPLACLRLPTTLLFSSDTLTITALVDSGAEGNLIDRELVEQLELSVEPLKTPVNANALDNRFMAKITHRTLPVPVTISGNHHELIQFHVISAPQSPLVLGYTWLALHNPHIDWTTGTVLSWSPHCAARCLRSVVPPTLSATSDPTPEPTDLSGVPSVYHDLGEVFRKDLALSLPPHRPYDCSIDLLPGAPLPSSRLYNLSRPERDSMEQYIKQSLQAGLIRPSSSPLGAGFFFVGKKDGSLRPCIDYRSLNDITIKNKYPLPLLNSAFDSLSGAAVFTKLDLRNAYHLVRIREGDEWKTAFKTPLGHFEYLVMPFGLTNAPAVFQNLVNDVLRDFLNRFVFVYLDDILIYSPTITAHQQHVRLVLQRLLENRLYVKAEKCEFHASTVSFLGFVIEQGRMRADPGKIRAVTDWPVPKTRKRRAAVPGLCQFLLQVHQKL